MPTTRSYLALRTIIRWSVRSLACLAGFVLLGACVMFGLSERRARHRFSVPEHSIAVPNDSATIARGQHVTTIRGCVDCHGGDLAGRVVLDDPAVGRLVGANLTRGGRGAELGVRDWERAVRHGVRPDSTSLLIMPAHEFTSMSDEDLAAIVAYARSLPAVRVVPPSTRAGPVVRALHLMGDFVLLPAEQIDHAKPHPSRVPIEPTARYGRYLAAGCTGCHGPNLSGGKIPGAPPDWRPAANITPTGIGHYTEADFIRALRTGRRPGGTAIDTLMPWRLTREMTDVELRAMYAYLQTVPAREYGIR